MIVRLHRQRVFLKLNGRNPLGPHEKLFLIFLMARATSAAGAAAAANESLSILAQFGLSVSTFVKMPLAVFPAELK